VYLFALQRISVTCRQSNVPYDAPVASLEMTQQLQDSVIQTPASVEQDLEILLKTCVFLSVQAQPQSAILVLEMIVF
jgi:hypothetical protein